MGEKKFVPITQRRYLEKVRITFDKNEEVLTSHKNRRHLQTGQVKLQKKLITERDRYGDEIIP